MSPIHGRPFNLGSFSYPLADSVLYSTDYGGLGLDYSYALAVAEELGNINCGAIPMAIGVQTDMATPALAR